MSLSKLSKLPTEVLSCVLNNGAIPLGHRLQLRLLCNRWADIIEDGLMKETSLVLRDEKAELYRIREPDDLVIQSTDLTDEFTRPLSRLFTSLTQLTIDFGVDASWSKVPTLLAFLNSTNLTAVKLYGFKYADKLMGAISAALACLPALTSLTLVGYHFSNLLLPYLGPVLSRLQALGCIDNSGDSAGIISSFLSSRCTHLWLHSDDFESFKSPFLLELSRHLTHLHLLDCDATTWQSISQMHRVSSLALEFFGHTDLDASLFSKLAPISHLTNVKLYRLNYGAPLALPSKKETPLSSIKRLTLEVDFGDEDSPVDYPAFFSAISAWFPKLVKLTLTTASYHPSQGNPGKLSFSVEVVDRNSVNYCTSWSADW